MRRIHLLWALCGLLAAGCMNMAGYERGATVSYKEALKQKDDLVGLVEQELEQGHTARAYHAFELLRTRAFVARSIASKKAKKGAPRVTAEYRDVRDLFEKAYLASSGATGGTSRGLGGVRAARKQALQKARAVDDELFWKDFRKTEKRLKAYEETMSYTELKYRAIFKDRYVVVSELDTRLTLSLDEAALEFFVGRKKAYAFVLTARKITAHEIPLAPAELAAGVRDLVGKLAGGEQGWDAPARKLDAALIQPLVAELEGVHSLFIVPHGVLGQLPFGVLLSGDGPEAMLLARYRLTYLPSYSVLKSIHSRPLPAKAPRLLAIGNPKSPWAEGIGLKPLAAAEREAETVAAVFDGSALLRGAKATESSLMQRYGQYNILHFATHGLLSAGDPSASNLLLAEESGSDGLLTAAEIAAMKLTGKYVVVLSACETAVTSDAAAADDLGSLTGAFLLAGAPAVVGSFWQVDDASTTELMLGFYEKFLELGTSEALRQAQLALAAQEGYAHPYYWAAFALFGFDK